MVSTPLVWWCVCVPLCVCHLTRIFRSRFLPKTVACIVPLVEATCKHTVWEWELWFLLEIFFFHLVSQGESNLESRVPLSLASGWLHLTPIWGTVLRNQLWGGGRQLASLGRLEIVYFNWIARVVILMSVTLVFTIDEYVVQIRSE